jgi:hypothetical protein
MAKRKRHKRVSQCECCAVSYCREAQQIECAKAEFVALAEGEVYVCPFFDEGYWEKLCA